MNEAFGQHNGKPERRAIRKDRAGSAPVEPPPTTFGEALMRDLREARKHFRDVNERIGAMCGISGKSVYDWKDREHQWTDLQVRAVVIETGGRHARAFLARLARTSHTALCEDDLSQGVTDLVVRAAELNRQYFADVAPGDDTPCVLDRRERVALVQIMDSALAVITDMRDALAGEE